MKKLTDRFGYQGQEKGDAGSPWYQFELRMYNPDLGRWFTPDPYGQFASPYIAMGNNPVSTVDPDGGWVNFYSGIGSDYADNKYNTDRSREERIGAYALDATQARYDDTYKNLVNQFLPKNGHRDIDGFLLAVNELNTEYAGLTYLSKTHVAYKNGSESLTLGEAARFGQSIAKNQGDVMADVGDQTVTKPDVKYENTMEEFDVNKREGRIKTGTISFTRVSAWFGGDGQIDTQVKVTDMDGTSTSTFYDLNGNVTDVYYRYGPNPEDVRRAKASDGNTSGLAGEDANIGAAQSGGGVTVYIENDGIGHAYLEVKGTVFSYGRYDGSYSPSSGPLGPIGKGVLLKKDHSYVVDHMNMNPTSVYNFPNANANAIYNYLNNIYNSGTAAINGGMVVDTYFLIGNNCTSTTCGALQVGGVNIPTIQVPADFNSYMSNPDFYNTNNNWLLK